MESEEWRVESGEWGVESGEWRVGSGEWGVKSGRREVSGTGKRLMTWLHFLNDWAETDKVLNVWVR